jgi:hypothetical protein
MNANRVYRMLRLMKAGEVTIPADVAAECIERHGIDVAHVEPAGTFERGELVDLLVQAGIDPEDVGLDDDGEDEPEEAPAEVPAPRKRRSRRKAEAAAE